MNVKPVNVEVIVSLKEDFDRPLNELRNILDTCDDGCSNGHYLDLQGHPLVCSLEDGGCMSRLRILRAASVHYPVLRKFLSHLYCAIQDHKNIRDIDESLASGDFQRLMELTKSKDFVSLFSNEVDTTYEECTDTSVANSVLRRPNLESDLQISYAHLIAELDKEIDDFPDKECCCCHQLIRENL